MTKEAKAGYIYVLTHPSLPNEYKIGVTTRTVEEKLAQDNTNYSKIAGQIVKDTGLKWILKEYYPVDDIYYAKSAFWSGTGIADIPFRGGVDICSMDSKTLQVGLNAAKSVGIRPKPKQSSKQIHNREWMIGVLQHTGIKLVGDKFNHIQYADFECSRGHVFRAIPRIIARHKSCPECDSVH